MPPTTLPTAVTSTSVTANIESSGQRRAMSEGCRALATFPAGSRAASDSNGHRIGATAQMTTAEQQQTSSLNTSCDATLNQGAMLSIKHGNLRGIEQVAKLHLHEGISGGAGDPDSCSVSGSSPGAGSDANETTHAASTSEQPTYCDKAYWDNRYARELAPGSAAPPHFDWYIGYAGSPLQEMLREHVPLALPVLQVGVGTSQMQRQMVEDGYSNILSTDVSPAAYEMGDCRSMPQYEDAAFAAVIDKGTLDAIMCGERAEADAAAMVSECHRVLQPGGVFLEVSYGRPSLRLPYLQTPGVEWAGVTASGVRHPQACGEVPNGETVIRLPPLLGPYDASEAGALDGIEVDNYYFAYVCWKPR